MLVVEAKLKNGTPEQYQKLNEAIRTAQFVRNKCVKYWMENKGTTRNDLITFTDGFKAGTFDLWCSQKTLLYYSEKQIKRLRVVRRADGYYCQFIIDHERQEKDEFTGSVVGIDLGLKEFYTDSQGNTVENPRFFRQTEKRLRKLQRRLSNRYQKGQKQSNNYHKQRHKVAKLHLKVSRQRKDRAIKDALALIQFYDLVVYEALKVSNLVKNHKLAKSISDASWYQFTQWVNKLAKIHKITCIAVPPQFTTIDCSVCEAKVYKSLSTRTHQCPHCKTVLDRDLNAAINILKKGLKYLGEYLNGTAGQAETDPNDWGESGLWVFNRDVNDLSRFVEPVISRGDSERISRHGIA